MVRVRGVVVRNKLRVSFGLQLAGSSLWVGPSWILNKTKQIVKQKMMNIEVHAPDLLSVNYRI